MRAPRDRQRDHGDAAGRSRARVWAVVAAFVLCLVLVAVAVAREPPDRTLTSRVTAVDPHRLCLADSDDGVICLANERPSEVAWIENSDCVRVRYSPERIVVSVVASQRCG